MANLRNSRKTTVARENLGPSHGDLASKAARDQGGDVGFDLDGELWRVRAKDCQGPGLVFTGSLWLAWEEQSVSG